MRNKISKLVVVPLVLLLFGFGNLLAVEKKELTLEVMNEKGQVAMRYFLHACWVSEFTAMPDLDANANAVAIENMKIELEGWERDLDTTEPDEAS